MDKREKRNLVKEYKRKLAENKRKELEDLLSLSNPENQCFIEKGLRIWVESYEARKVYTVHDVYNDWGDSKYDIPEYIKINGGYYTPHQILEHIENRDNIGLDIIGRIIENKKLDPIWRNFMMRVTIEENSPLEMGTGLSRGYGEVKYKELLLLYGLPKAIMGLYKPVQLWFDLSEVPELISEYRPLKYKTAEKKEIID